MHLFIITNCSKITPPRYVASMLFTLLSAKVLPRRPKTIKYSWIHHSIAHMTSNMSSIANQYSSKGRKTIREVLTSFLSPIYSGPIPSLRLKRWVIWPCGNTLHRHKMRFILCWQKRLHLLLDGCQSGMTNTSTICHMMRKLEKMMYI